MMSALSFTGCGGKENSENKNGTGEVNTVSEEQSVKERAFKVVEMGESEDGFTYYDISYAKGNIYSTYTDYRQEKAEDGTDNYYYDLYIYVLEDTGKVITKIPVFIQEQPDEYASFTQRKVGVDENGNISVIAEIGTMDRTTYEQDTKYHLLKYDKDGNPLSDKEIPDLLTQEERSSGMYMWDIMYDGNGNIFALFDNCVKVFDGEGNYLFTTDNLTESGGGYVDGIILTNEGVPAVGVQIWGDTGSSFKLIEIDVQSGGPGAVHEFPEYVSGISSGSGDYICYARNDTGVAGYRADTLQKENVLNLLNIGVDTNQIDFFTPCDDGSFITGGYTFAASRSGSSNFVVSHIIPIDESEVVPKKTLTLGCFSMDQFWRGAISEFNRTNEEYTISAVSYADNNDTTDWDSAVTNFNNELLSGNIPDMLLLDASLPVDSYINKGLFADIYQLMDGDSEYNKDSFLPNILQLSERDGKLCSLPMSFSVQTYVGKSSRINVNEPFTFEKARELLAAMPEGAALLSEDMTNSRFITEALQYSSFIDYENATCNFDSDEFKAILEMSKDYPSEIDYSTYDQDYYDEMPMRVSEDKALLMNEYIYQFNDFNYVENGLLGGEEAAFAGFPGTSGANGVVQLNSRIAIAEKSENKAGAWEFIKRTLDDIVYEQESEVYNPTADEDDEPYMETRWTTGMLHMGFPVIKEDLERIGIQETIPYKMFNENGELVDRESNFSMNGIKIKNSDLSEDDIHRYIDYLSSVDTIWQADTTVSDIIDEEISAFTSGAKSAEETAQIIQSKVSIYLSEQYG